MFALITLSACTPGSTASSPTDQRLKVLATTTIVGDVVGAIAGEDIELSVLLPPGVDPHTFEPSPQDIAMLSEADIVFTNGAGLEAFMERILANAGGDAVVVPVSEGIDLINAVHEDEHGGDPHVWTDPNNVMLWVSTIEGALSESDPENASTYQEKADAYRQALSDLDSWIQEQVTQIPKEKRVLFTDHETLAYFARRYGFEQGGAVIPAFSTLAQPSAQEVAALEDELRRSGAGSIFVDVSANPALSRRIADDTLTQVISIYSGSLSKPDGPAPTYLEMMRYNVNAIVQALSHP